MMTQALRLVSAAAVAIVIGLAGLPTVHDHIAGEAAFYNSECVLEILATGGAMAPLPTPVEVAAPARLSDPPTATPWLPGHRAVSPPFESRAPPAR